MTPLTEVVAMVALGILAIAIGFAYGKIVGFNDGRPKRDEKGRFKKRS